MNETALDSVSGRFAGLGGGLGGCLGRRRLVGL